MLAAITDEIWAFEDDLRLPGGMLLPCRTTILRLGGGRLVVHSPLAIDDALAAEIEALGEVAFIVAPSCIHFLFLEAAAARWPNARVLGAPGLEKKLGRAFEPLASDSFGAELRVQMIDGVPAIREHVFLEPRSRSLIVSDLIFNVYETKGFGMELFLRAVGAWKKPAQSRFWRFLTKDRARVSADVATVLDWDFDRIVVAHGLVIDTGAKDIVADALAWLRPKGLAENVAAS